MATTTVCVAPIGCLVRPQVLYVSTVGQSDEVDRVVDDLEDMLPVDITDEKRRRFRRRAAEVLRVADKTTRAK